MTGAPHDSAIPDHFKEKAMHRFLCLLCCLLSLSAWGADKQPMVLAVHPYLPSAEIQQRFSPMANYLSRVLDRPVEVRVGRDYDEHVDAIGRNEVDIAFMGPSLYVLTVARYGKKPLLARLETKGKPVLTGVIICRKDSPLRTLADLKGRRFAFGDKDSTMSALVPQYMLQTVGVALSDLAGYEYLGGHKNVALGVLGGDYDAGAVKEEVFKEFEPRGLRVLAPMAQVSEHLFVTRSDMSPALVEKLRKALLNIKSEPNGEVIMHSIHKEMTNLVPVEDSDYQSLRTIMRTIGILH